MKAPWALGSVLLFVGTQASAQSATGSIAFRGAVAESTVAVEQTRSDGSSPDAPRRVSRQTLDPTKARLLEYFAEHGEQAGIARDRLVLISVDYL